MAKKQKKTEETDAASAASPSKKDLNSIILDPLLWISAITALSTLAMPFFGAGTALLFVAILGILLLSSGYFAFLHIKKGSYAAAVFPVLILVTLLFSLGYQGNIAQDSLYSARDNVSFAMSFGVLVFLYALAFHGLMRVPTAAICAIVFSMLIIHMSPAYTPSDYNQWTGQYISDLDSYFHYRHAKDIVKTGVIAENETLIYPTNPPSFSNQRLGSSVFMASLATALQGFGFDAHDMAMLYPGVVSAFIALLAYLLMRELFSDMKPYNEAVGILAAFMLIVNPSFASRAIATNSEDDTFGMFLLLASFVLFALSLRKRSLRIAGLAGVALLFLNLSWSGYTYGVVVLGLFGMMYALSSLIAGRNCTQHIPYMALTLIPSLLYPLVLHTKGVLPSFGMPENFFVLFFGGAIFVSFMLESLRGGMASKKGADTDATPVEKFLQNNALSIFAITLLCAAGYVFVISSPGEVAQYFVSLVSEVKQSEIIGMTTAEQRALCDGGFSSECITTINDTFGIGALFGMLMIPVLIYLSLFKRSVGATFALVFGVPLLYGVVDKSQFQFAASVPIILLGATIGLLFTLKRKDADSVRILPTIIFIAIVLGFPLLNGGVFLFGPFGGATPMYMGVMADRVYWQGTFDWLSEQPEDILVLTWWDYGHWIAAISERMSILDNTKHDRYMVQDIARFHVVSESEDEALEIAKKYNATHVVIDFSMIGKSGAPHFIGTSGLGDYLPLKTMLASAECVGGTGCTDLIKERGSAVLYTGQSASMTVDFTAAYLIDKVVMNLPETGSYNYLVEGSNDRENWSVVVDRTKSSASGLQEESFMEETYRYLKITPTYSSTGEFTIESLKVYNPRKEGSYLGYGQCGFNTEASMTKSQLRQNENGEYENVRNLIYSCNNGLHLLFEVINEGQAVEPYVIVQNQKIPWSAWMENSGASLLGVQSPARILGNAMTYPDGSRFISFQTFNTFVYVPKDAQYDMNNVMMTKLYLGDYLEEYQRMGLAQTSIEKARYFRLVDGFLGDATVMDNSWLGYVRTYEILYPDASDNSTSS